MKKFIAVLSIGVLTATLYINFLGGTGGINDIATGEVSGQYPALFTPAGFTFAIWSLIYLFNIGFVAVAVFGAFKEPDVPTNSLLRNFILICLFNCGWIFAWHYGQIEVSVALMLGLLISLIISFIGTLKLQSGGIANIIIKANFSIYLAWISVASIANISAMLIDWGVADHDMTAVVMTVIVISVAALLASWQLIKFKNGWYAAVVIWALYGIYQARIAEFSTLTQYVAWAALIAIVVVLVAGGYVFTKKFVRLRS